MVYIGVMNAAICNMIIQIVSMKIILSQHRIYPHQEANNMYYSNVFMQYQ